jgi:predicted NAD/FAD-binding protein
VIVGAGAAGVFTAYEIQKSYPGQFDVRLFEAGPTIGGNVSSVDVEYGGQTYVIDAGAQFFYGKAQPNYLNLIGELGLDDQIPLFPAGITIWDAATDRRLLWVPSTVGGHSRYTVADWRRLVEFGEFLVAAALLNASSDPDWSLSVSDWLADVPLDDSFQQDVILNFLYQFVSLPYPRIGEASAVYATTYFVRSVFGTPSTGSAATADPASIPLFQTNQSMIGLLGILEQALAESGVVAQTSSPVTAVAPGEDGVTVTVDGTPITAQHVVLACDPAASGALLAAGGTAPSDLVVLLQELGEQYLDLSIVLQQNGACWMPSDESYWEGVTTLADTANQAVTFSAWFGPLRPPYDGDLLIPVFKSWGSPDLDMSSCADTFYSHVHDVPLPTTDFIALRDQLGAFQGRDGLLFAGGWTDWFDSQEAALLSAMNVVSLLKPAGAEGAARAPAAYDAAAVTGQVRSWLDLVRAHAPAEFQADLAGLSERLA